MQRVVLGPVCASEGTAHAAIAALRPALYTAAGITAWRVARTALARRAAGESDRARPERRRKGQPLGVGREELDDVPWFNRVRVGFRV